MWGFLPRCTVTDAAAPASMLNSGPRVAPFCFRFHRGMQAVYQVGLARATVVKVPGQEGTLACVRVQGCPLHKRSGGHHGGVLLPVL
jgi:hypothetical protein